MIRALVAVFVLALTATGAVWWLWADDGGVTVDAIRCGHGIHGMISWVAVFAKTERLNPAALRFASHTIHQSLVPSGAGDRADFLRCRRQSTRCCPR